MTSVVDALGGLDVESDLEFDTGWESGAEIHVNEGMNHFDGISALAFCRERQALPDRGQRKRSPSAGSYHCNH